MEGGFDGFEEAALLGGVQLEAVLDHRDDGREGGLFERGGFVRAEGFAKEQDAEIPLGLKEREKVGGGGFGGGGGSFGGGGASGGW
mgnify:CR=1 FL=1